jgi:tRNA G18 (ribose-2'-O)-methylase SpoU
MTDRVPFQVTEAARIYESAGPLPVSVLLDNVRSMYNVGSFFRTMDGVGAAKLYLSGITARPPKSAISKTALGAEDSVPWEHSWEPVSMVRQLRMQEPAESCSTNCSENTVNCTAGTQCHN